MIHPPVNSSNTYLIPEEATHAPSVLNSGFFQAVNLATTRHGRERLCRLVTDTPHSEAIQESHGFIQRFRHDTTVKKIADALGKVEFNIIPLSRIQESELNTSFFIDQSTVDAKSIYSRDNLEENSIQGYRKLIKSVESIQTGMDALDSLRDMIEANGMCPELANILRERSEINSIRETIGIVRRSGEQYTVLADRIAYVLGPKVDPYLDVCREMYGERLMSCQRIIDDIQASLGLEIYFGKEREICLMRRNSSVENVQKPKPRTGQRLFIIKESKTLTLYSTRELKVHNKAIRGLLDQIVEIQGRLCKAVLLRLQRHEPFFTKVSALVARLDQLISNLVFSSAVGFKRPRISTRTAIHGASHVLFPSYQKAEYLFEMGVYVITGANMAGKSCYVRNFLHIAVLAKIGCYVGSDAAEIPLFDEIYFVGSIADLNLLVSNVLRRQLSTSNGYQTPTRLVAVDELHCSTSIQLHLLELLRHTRTLTLFVTHRSELIVALQARGYDIYHYENYQLKKGMNTQSSVAKICERYFPELNMPL